MEDIIDEEINWQAKYDRAFRNWQDEIKKLKKWNMVGIDEDPKICIEVIGYNKEWIDEDYNPDGTCICFIDDLGHWSIAMWNNITDEWSNIWTGDKRVSVPAPSHWMNKPTPPNE